VVDNGRHLILGNFRAGVPHLGDHGLPVLASVSGVADQAQRMARLAGSLNGFFTGSIGQRARIASTLSKKRGAAENDCRQQREK
jgi:hypothetical protein